MTLDQLYQQHIRPLSAAERLRLMAKLAGDLVPEDSESESPRKRDIMELRGLGKEIWEGIDPEEYVNELRGEWERNG